MCRNHSHLMARYVGEDTSGLAPVLMFDLANTELTIEGPFPGGVKLIVPTSGRLLLPSWSLDGYFRSLSPVTAERSMSLCLLPGDVMTITQLALTDAALALEQLQTTLETRAASRIPATGATAKDDVPF